MFQIKDVDKLKFTKITNYRINFRYKNRLYSLNLHSDGGEDVLTLWDRDNSTSIVSEYCRNFSIRDYIKTNGIQNVPIVYSHIDKQYFADRLNEFILLNSNIINAPSDKKVEDFNPLDSKSDKPVWYYKQLEEVSNDYVVFNLLRTDVFVLEMYGIKYEIRFVLNEDKEINVWTTYNDIEESTISSRELIESAFRSGKWYILTKKNTTKTFKKEFDKRKAEKERQEQREFYIRVIAVTLKNVEEFKNCTREEIEEMLTKWSDEDLEKVVNKISDKCIENKER